MSELMTHQEQMGGDDERKVDVCGCVMWMAQDGFRSRPCCEHASVPMSQHFNRYLNGYPWDTSKYITLKPLKGFVDAN